MRILTNFLNAPERLEIPDGSQAEITRAETWAAFRQLCSTADLIVVDCRDLLVYRLAAYFTLFPWKRRPIAAVDLVLRRPFTLRHKATALVKKFLLSRIDHFVHYFKDISGYSEWFGVPASRSSYVPFKSNIWGSTISTETLREEYIFTMGVSLRDYDTFIRAVGDLPYPAAIPEYSLLHFEGRTPNFLWSKSNVPKNLSVLPDSGNRQDLLNNMARAKVVVIPVQAYSVCASGISTYLDAMYLGKCVVMTEGPGASDLLTEQALLVPANDVDALRSAIRRAWEDDELRRRTASSGREYAISLGGEQELLLRVFIRCISVFTASRNIHHLRHSGDNHRVAATKDRRFL